jgi:hypothetical protein
VTITPSRMEFPSSDAPRALVGGIPGEIASANIFITCCYINEKAGATAGLRDESSRDARGTRNADISRMIAEAARRRQPDLEFPILPSKKGNHFRKRVETGLDPSSDVVPLPSKTDLRQKSLLDRSALATGVGASSLSPEPIVAIFLPID